MKIEEVVYQAKSNGYFFVQDINGFINVYDTEDIFKENADIQCIYRSKCDCKSKRDFDCEIIYLVNKIDTFVWN